MSARSDCANEPNRAGIRIWVRLVKTASAWGRREPTTIRWVVTCSARLTHPTQSWSVEVSRVGKGRLRRTNPIARESGVGFVSSKRPAWDRRNPPQYGGLRLAGSAKPHPTQSWSVEVSSVGKGRLRRTEPNRAGIRSLGSFRQNGYRVGWAEPTTIRWVALARSADPPYSIVELGSEQSRQPMAAERTQSRESGFRFVWSKRPAVGSA